jgi:hypothetical protein
MGRVLWRRRWGILSGLVRIGRHGHCGHYEQALSGGGWVRVRSLCVHLNPDSSAANRLGGRRTGGRPHEDPLVDSPRRDCAHGRQRPRDYEQYLQEQPSRMVRSNVRYPIPREDWAQLIAAPRTAPKDVAAVGDDVVVSSRCDPSSTDGRSGSRKLARTSTAAGLPPGSASRYRRRRHSSLISTPCPLRHPPH